MIEPIIGTLIAIFLLALAYIAYSKGWDDGFETNQHLNEKLVEIECILSILNERADETNL